MYINNTFSTSHAKYKNLSDEIYWTCKGYDQNYEKESQIIKSHKMNIGDIIYVGTKYETRPEYGWSIVYDNQGHYLSLENGANSLIDIMETSENSLSPNYLELKKYIYKHNIKYQNAFRNILNSELDFCWFDLEYYGQTEFDTIVQKYKKHKLW